jgi:hypothetical protein
MLLVDFGIRHVLETLSPAVFVTVPPSVSGSERPSQQLLGRAQTQLSPNFPDFFNSGNQHKRKTTKDKSSISLLWRGPLVQKYFLHIREQPDGFFGSLASAKCAPKARSCLRRNIQASPRNRNCEGFAEDGFSLSRSCILVSARCRSLIGMFIWGSISHERCQVVVLSKFEIV